MKLYLFITNYEPITFCIYMDLILKCDLLFSQNHFLRPRMSLFQQTDINEAMNADLHYYTIFSLIYS